MPKKPRGSSHISDEFENPAHGQGVLTTKMFFASICTNVLTGLLIGYALFTAEGWTRDLFIADWNGSEHNVTSEFHPIRCDVTRSVAGCPRVRVTPNTITQQQNSLPCYKARSFLECLHNHVSLSLFFDGLTQALSLSSPFCFNSSSAERPLPSKSLFLWQYSVRAQHLLRGLHVHCQGFFNSTFR